MSNDSESLILPTPADPKADPITRILERDDVQHREANLVGKTGEQKRPSQTWLHQARELRSLSPFTFEGAYDAFQGSSTTTAPPTATVIKVVVQEDPSPKGRLSNVPESLKTRIVPNTTLWNIITNLDGLQRTIKEFRLNSLLALELGRAYFNDIPAVGANAGAFHNLEALCATLMVHTRSPVLINQFLNHVRKPRHNFGFETLDVLMIRLLRMWSLVGSHISLNEVLHHLFTKSLNLKAWRERGSGALAAKLEQVSLNGSTLKFLEELVLNHRDSFDLLGQGQPSNATKVDQPRQTRPHKDSKEKKESSKPQDRPPRKREERESTGDTKTSTKVPPRPCKHCKGNHWDSDCPEASSSTKKRKEDKKVNPTNTTTPQISSSKDKDKKNKSGVNDYLKRPRASTDLGEGEVEVYALPLLSKRFANKKKILIFSNARHPILLLTLVVYWPKAPLHG